MDFASFDAHCLYLDLETGRDGRIHRIGAVQGERTFAGSGRDDLRGLESFAAGAEIVAGHNLTFHDLPILQEVAPKHPVGALPVVDTLILSPLAFPRNPYHHLVKDYKLVKDAVNDPVADAQLARRLLEDEWKSFAAARCGEGADRVRLFRHHLDDRGANRFFEALGATELDAGKAAAAFRDATRGTGCDRAAAELARLPPEAALAYVLAWLPVAGGNSVLPRWARRQYPRITEHLDHLRTRPCDDLDCEWCHGRFDASAQLTRWFGFEDFRRTPRTADGGSLQEAVVRAGLADQPLLAILPTGGGKSLCYQLPALARAERRGALTLIISPLQALMKDQVDNLNARTGSTSAAALSGLLTPLERGAVLRGVGRGDVSILYVSPEQLRNRSFTRTLAWRELGAVVFDEAHCLSKWGHDFRPDYLYASRFLREFTAGEALPLPTIACFTATAKRDVKEEILRHFLDELDQELALFEGGVERENLSYRVLSSAKPERLATILEELGELETEDGAAVVYTATRKGAEELAEQLEHAGHSVRAFHAGLNAPVKREVQESFIRGDTRVMCATNAFGMGIDKEDVRVVIHADMPGSLENYLQEAGRAGRDRHPARCVLLFSEEDLETQFGLSGLSQLHPTDFREILRSIRKAAGRGRRGATEEPIVLTSGEILRDETVETTFDAEESMADTKVKTAVAWLERGGFLRRNENVNQVFQGRPVVSSLEEARERLIAMRLPAERHRRYDALLSLIFDTPADEGLTIDEIAREAAFEPEEGVPAVQQSESILRALQELARAGLIRQGLQLTAFVRKGVSDASNDRLESVVRLEHALLDLLEEAAPDATEEEWLPLSLRRTNQRLLDEGHSCRPDRLRTLLQSLAADGRGLAGSHGSLDLSSTGRERLRLRIRRSWSDLKELAGKRRDVAAVVLRTILAASPETSRGADLLMDFAMDDLVRALRDDLILSERLTDPLAAVERALLFLHEQEVITLQKGLAIFRSAMTLELVDEAKGRRFSHSDFEALARHYAERTFQIHVMAEYARRAGESIVDALRLVRDYFETARDDFARKYFADREEIVERAVSEALHRRIVDELGNEVQTAIVTAPKEENALVLAGPGSGKTRALIHRIAYLVKVHRVAARRILALSFNRSAASEIRRRLRDLIGADAGHVVVLTFHGLACRLLGVSPADRRAADGDLALDELVPRAVGLLEGTDDAVFADKDELRERLLRGFRHILIDEYQDIDAPQYELITALTGRTLKHGEKKLTILAVGDDDQNIYTFRGANVEFIRRFAEEYQAREHLLVENYRSTRAIIEVANRLIAANRDRMKGAHPIRIDAARRAAPAGTPVMILGCSLRDEALAVVTELEALEASGADLGRAAVLARTRETLHDVRTLLEERGIDFDWSLDREQAPPLHRTREFRRLLDELEANRQRFVRATRLREGVRRTGMSPWSEMLDAFLEAFVLETGERSLPAGEVADYLYEASAEARQETAGGRGVHLSTAHGAKGLEFDHVLLPAAGWRDANSSREMEEERRLYYVAMTRARESLHLFEPIDPPHPFLGGLDGALVHRTPAAAYPEGGLGRERRRYHVLGLSDLYLDFAGRGAPHDPIHSALARLETGSPVHLRPSGEHVFVVTEEGTAVARLSAAAVPRVANRLDCIEQVRVHALVRRTRDDVEDPGFRKALRAERWEIPLLELVERRDASG